MLFDLFRKNKQQDVINLHLNGFQQSFSEIQKEAILQALFIIANIDGKYHKKEVKFFELAAETLGYDLGKDYLDKLLLITPEHQFNILKNLNESQKDWFIVTIFGMFSADGTGKEVEFNTMGFILDNMGISSERVDRVLNKYNAITSRFL